MRCHDARKQLQLYIDNQLTMNQVRELEGHIAQCDACSRELSLLEEITSSLRQLQHMTMLIMQRVANSPQRHTDGRFSLWRPSLTELLMVVVLASITTLGVIWLLPSLRNVLPFAAPLSQTFSYVIHLLYSADMGAISLALWVVGTILGIFITLALAGDEIRTQWFKAVLERLPVH